MNRWLRLLRNGGMLIAFGVAVNAEGVPAVVAARSPEPPMFVSGVSGVNEPPHPSVSAADKEMAQAIALRKKLTQRDLQAAIRLFVDSAGRFARSGSRQKAALAELEAGDTYQMMSSYRKALAAYRRSLVLGANEPGARCAALSHMARTYANIGRLPDAARYSDQAVALCVTLSDKKAIADAVEAQGETRFWASNIADATASFTRARQLASESNDPDGEALNTMMLAESVTDSDPGQSSRLAWRAIGLWLGTENFYMAARAHMVLAFLAAGTGNFGTALCHCGVALPVFQRVADKDDAAIALNVMGMLARQSGDVESSLNYYRRARNEFAAAEDDLGEAESITGMADDLVSQHKYQALLPLYTRKLHLAQKTGNRAFFASALVNVASAFQFQHRPFEAEKNYERGLAEYRAAGNRYGESTTEMRFAGLRMEQGKLAQALELLDHARELKEQTGEIEDLARIQYLRARIFLAQNRLEEARSEIEKTIAIIESQRLRITKFDSRAEYFASVHGYYSLYIRILMALHELHPDEKYDQLAFEAAEKSKVRSLLDLLQNTPPSPPCAELLARETNPNSTGTSGKALPEPETTSAQALTLPQIQAELGDDDTVLLEYALGDDRSYAWLVDRAKISQFTLAPAWEIRTQARDFREGLLPAPSLKDETTSAYLQRRHAAKVAQSRRSKKLASLLVGSLELPPQKRLLIVPDGPLQYIPFAALPVAHGVKQSTLLGEEYELSLLPSASVLASLRKAAARRPPPTDGVVIFADPVFESGGNDSGAATIETAERRSRDLNLALKDSSGWQHIPSLPGSRREALSIQRIVGHANARLALGFNATRQSVVDGSLAHNRVIHFATHGIVDTRHPEMSGLILSLVNPRGERVDGYLRLSDIYNLKLSADLIVLSSCESALGKDLESEGTIGLPRGFLYAGARSVIASLWKVDDDATSILMKALYSRMQRGESPSRALHGAQLDLSTEERYADPYYWAGFVLEGDYQ
jgi:CHAT domain-containing protein/tetratricopeptide (TPR) repeat protein